MRRSELRAAQGIATEGPAAEAEELKYNPRGTIWDMLVPLLALMLFAVLALMYTGGYWGADPKFHGFQAAIGNSSASISLVFSSFGALIVALLMYVPRKLMSFGDFFSGSVEGMKLMLPANIILILAWTLSGVCRDLLSTPAFVQHVVTDGGFAASFLPAVIFLVAAFLSFSTGTAWGTFGILIPIVVPVAQALDPSIITVALSATLAGSVFGDHSSPISDTTILSSAGARCSHIEHVATQLPYATLVAICCFVGYCVAGFTHGSFLPSFLSAFACLIVAMLVLHRISVRRQAREAEAQAS